MDQTYAIDKTEHTHVLNKNIYFLSMFIKYRTMCNFDYDMLYHNKKITQAAVTNMQKCRQMLQHYKQQQWNKMSATHFVFKAKHVLVHNVSQILQTISKQTHKLCM